MSQDNQTTGGNGPSRPRLPERIRVASLQYFIRPVQSFSQFADQVEALVATAADYECSLVVFPEYFTLQLLTLGKISDPMPEQIRALASRAPEFVDLMSRLAKQYYIYIVAGTIPHIDADTQKLHNDCFIFNRMGQYDLQGKLHLTRFEREDWKVNPRAKVKIFDTEFGKIVITICYDVEFPEMARAGAHAGAHILICPSYTDDRQGFLRVRYCAHARAIENQMYVIHSSTVGALLSVPEVSLNYGQAAIITPSDFPFARDGILAEGIPNQETMVIGELNLKTIRTNRSKGTVIPLRDSQQTGKLVKDPVTVTL